MALSRCTTLEGLEEHFKQTFEDGKSGNSKIKKVLSQHFKERTQVACMTFDPNDPIVFNHDEPELDGS